MNIVAAKWYDLRDLGNPIGKLVQELQDAGLSEGWLFVIAGLLGAIGILSFVGVAAVIDIWIERRLLAKVHVRRGPNRVGPFGLLQPVADAIKLIQKEALQPDAADGIVFTLAPILIFIPAILAFAVFPWGEHMILADLNVGVLFILALGSTTTIMIFMAGYASNNKYALLGSMRVISMLISYELPAVLALLGVVLFAGTMSLSGIVAFQETYWVWLIFLQPLPLLIFLLGSTAELNRTPADIAEAESEIIAGFHIEYSGMKFGLFYAVELVNVIAVSAVITTLFLGGWWTFGLETFIPGWMLFIGKVYAVYFIFIWFRGTLPRFRVDQLMAFAWKFLLPLAIVNTLMVALQIFIWNEYELNAGVVLPIFGVVNFALAGALIFGFSRMMSSTVERFPKRPKLVSDIDVPLPEPSTA